MLAAETAVAFGDHLEAVRHASRDPLGPDKGLPDWSLQAREMLADALAQGNTPEAAIEQLQQLSGIKTSGGLRPGNLVDALSSSTGRVIPATWTTI
jgi:hypothetical protein